MSKGWIRQGPPSPGSRCHPGLGQAVKTEPPVPRPSSTVVLVRQGSTGAPQVLMVQRHAGDIMFGSAYVFPGGLLEPGDSTVHDFCTGLQDPRASALLGVDSGGLDYYSAAIRELFEETGILLGRAGSDSDLESSRNSLNDGSLDWDRWVRQAAVTLDCGSLRYFSHWVTPAFLPKRYSTRFFLAECPAGQEGSHDGGELTDLRWMPASEVIAAADAGDMTVHFPTLRTLSSIAQHADIESLKQWAESCPVSGVAPITPRRIRKDGQAELVIPGDEGYPE